MHGVIRRREELLDAAGSLTDAMLIFNERQTDIFVALLAEADTGRDGDVGLLDEELGKFQRTEMAELFRDLCPGEHGCRRRRHFETGLAESINHDVAAAAIDIAHFCDVGTVAVQGVGGRNLDRREGAVIQIGLYARQREISRSLPTAKPMRQPGMEKVFDMEVNSTVTSMAPGTSSTDGGGAFSSK